MVLNEKMLIIYDVSAIINVGAKANRQSKWCYNGIPTGGLYSLVNYIIQDRKKNANIIFCFDSPRSKSLRRHFYPDYKSNRGGSKLDLNFEDFEYDNVDNLMNIKKEIDLRGISETEIKNQAINESAILQLNLAMKMIKDLGLPFLYQIGYEADDLIYSLCRTYGEYKDIYIRADDNDLIDVKLFNKDIKFWPMTSKTINEKPLGVLQEKVFKGCNSDNILGLGSDKKWKDLRTALDKRFIHPFAFKTLINGELNLQPALQLGYNEQDAYEIASTFFCVYPFMFELSSKIFEGFEQELDVDIFINYLSAFGLKRALKSLGSDIKDNKQIQDYIEEVHSMISPILYYFLNS